MDMTALTNRLPQLRQPEYTGENRCMPCTAVNSVIAVVLAVGIAVLWPPAGLAALVVFFAAIYLRGYLVPGTPELTQRYMPDRVLRLFDKEPLEDGGQTDVEGDTEAETRAEEREPEEIEELLLDAGVVEECEDGDDLCLTGTFEEVWWRRIRAFREDETRATEQLAAVIQVDPDDLAFVSKEGTFGVTLEGDLIAKWVSDAAFYADLASEPTLSEWLPEWEELGDRRRTELLAGMRAFLEECPACETELEQVEDVRKSCCRGEFVRVSVDCEQCDATVFSGSHR